MGVYVYVCIYLTASVAISKVYSLIMDDNEDGYLSKFFKSYFWLMHCHLKLCWLYWGREKV